jgi:AcrR family transcriptional regulator
MGSEHYPGSGDIERTMALLWGTSKKPARGPKPGLTVERIVQAAVEIADANGLADLSMRAVAERLGVGTMSLYTYVPSKAELLDVVYDRVVGEQPLPNDGEGTWRDKLEAMAREEWRQFERHPWLLQVSGARAALGPHVLDWYESALGVVADVGLSGHEMVGTISLVTGYVRGTAQIAHEASEAQARTGMSDDQWWYAHVPLLEELMDSERFPVTASVQTSGAFEELGGDADYYVQRTLDDFEFGLERVLDGIGALIEKRTTA